MKLTSENVEYIRTQCHFKTDQELARELNVTEKTIGRVRKKLGIKKVNKLIEGRAADEQILETVKTEDDRKIFYKEQFANTLYYKNLRQQFTEEELQFYIEEWASLCIQFEDVLATEKRQIDELIKAEIMGNRILRNIKITEDEIENLTKEVLAYRASHDMQNEEAAQERDQAVMILIRSLSAQSNGMSNDYQKNVDLRNKLLVELNARRIDRADQISKRGTTFLSIVEELRDVKVREAQGRHMELVRIAKEHKKALWRKPQVFPDGTKDYILIDDQTEFNDKPIVSSDRIHDILDQKDGIFFIFDNDINRINSIKNKLNNVVTEHSLNIDELIEKIDPEKNYTLFVGNAENKAVKHIDTILKNMNIVNYSGTSFEVQNNTITDTTLEQLLGYLNE